MIRRYLVLPAAALAALAGGALGGAGAAGAAGAAGGPAVGLGFASSAITAGQQPTVEYQAFGLPGGSVLDLQRQFGTAGVWETILVLPGTKGAVKAPAVPMGTYAYRIWVQRRNQHIVGSSTKILYSYGTVPLSNLCTVSNNNNAIQISGNCQQSSTIQVGSSIFTYDLSARGLPDVPQYNTVIEVNATSCRSITFQWTLNEYGQPGQAALIEVVQAASDAQSATIPYGQIGSQTFSLDGGPWYLDEAVTGTGGQGIYSTATLSCYTATGLP